jgi:hypothetical protein
MSFVLKILEMLLDRHIRGSVLVEKSLHQNQFVYRAGMSMETALFQVVHRLEKSVKQKEIALGAFLDIEGAFDNTSFSATIEYVRERGLQEACCRWIWSMLDNRLVHTSLKGSSLTAKVGGGCPQGGILSPLLWNLVNGLLAATNDQGFNAYGYAVAIVIIVQGKFAHMVRELMQAALDMVSNWTIQEGLSISPHKTAIVPFTNRRKLEGLGPLLLRGKRLQMLDEVKYLGVTIDSKLSWNQHLQVIIRKTKTTFAVIRHTCGKQWGLRPKMVHWLYTRVIRPSIYYGALVWWPKAMQQTIKTQLSRIQRTACLAIMGVMRSTPPPTHSGNGGALGSDSARSADHGGSEDGTL